MASSSFLDPGGGSQSPLDLPPPTPSPLTPNCEDPGLKPAYTLPNMTLYPENSPTCLFTPLPQPIPGSQAMRRRRPRLPGRPTEPLGFSLAFVPLLELLVCLGHPFPPPPHTHPHCTCTPSPGIPFHPPDLLTPLTPSLPPSCLIYLRQTPLSAQETSGSIHWVTVDQVSLEEQGDSQEGVGRRMEWPSKMKLHRLHWEDAEATELSCAQRQQPHLAFVPVIGTVAV